MPPGVCPGLFKEIDDRALLAQREDVVPKLAAYGSARREIDEIRVALLKTAKMKGKTNEAELWADERLRRLLRAMEDESDE